MSSSENRPVADKTTTTTGKPQPGAGVGSIKTTNVFRLINFELYAKPNVIVMGIGIACFTGVVGYLAYMRSKYEAAGYYAAVQDDGKEVFLKKPSKWDT